VFFLCVLSVLSLCSLCVFSLCVSLCSLCVLSVFCLSGVFSPCSSCVLCVFFLCVLFVFSLHSLCVLSVFSVYYLCVLSVFCLCGVFSLCSLVLPLCSQTVLLKRSTCKRASRSIAKTGSFCMSFPVLFQGRFPGGHFYGFCAVFVHLRVPLGGSFSVFF